MAADSEPNDATRFNGLLTIYAVDNFKDRISQTRYVLRLDVSGKMVSLNFADHFDTSDLRSGMQVEVQGRQRDGYIQVDRLKISANPPE
jgi:hypothetical protein